MIPTRRLRLLLLAWTAVGAAATQAHPGVAVTGVEAVAMTVADADRTASFFTRVLSFEKVSEVEIAGEAFAQLEGVDGLRARVVRLRLGDESIELREYLTPRGRPAPADSRSNDGWFQHVAIVVSDMGRAYQRLRKNEVEHVSSEPQLLPAWNPSAGGLRAFYFKSPDGDVLELIQFPPGKGNPKWHRPTEALFLGIDHTAIVVGDTEASLRFYRDLLGFAVAGESENYGIEQERLSAVRGAHLQITSLRAGGGPGIELLEYLSPRDGRPFPADERANDLVHWQTGLLTTDVGAIARTAGARRLSASSGVIRTPAAALGFRKGVAVRDPDGHVVHLLER